MKGLLSKFLRIAVYAGPSGGHLFPAQAFSENFRRQHPDCKIDLITSRKGAFFVGRMAPKVFDRVHYLPDFGFPVRFSLQTFKPFFLAPYLFISAWSYLIRWRPHLCVGFGSFVSFPGVLTAYFLNIPTLIHEQNKIPGKATLWLAPYAGKIASSFDAMKILKPSQKTCTVGLPLRTLIVENERKTSLSQLSQKITLLVLGGSQGAHRLNEIVVTAMERLSREEREKIAVIHITGKRDCEWVTEKYKTLALSHEVYPFYERMSELFLKAHLAITRAGANTLFEMAFYGIPALVIPYPHAGNHQIENARAFALEGGLLFHEENEKAAEWLLGEFRGLNEDPERLKRMAEAMKRSARPNAGHDLATLAQEMIRDRYFHEDH